MTKPSDTQLVILTAAAQRDDRDVLPLPGSLRGGAATKVVGALLKRGLIAETTTDIQTKADGALNRIWRNDEDGRAILLHITDAGLAAIGVETDAAAEDAPDEAPTVPGAPDTAETAESATTGADTGAAAQKPRDGTKAAALLELLSRPEGASMAEMTAATGWQQHTVRSAIATTVRKKLGHEVVAEKPEGQDRRWRIAS